MWRERRNDARKSSAFHSYRWLEGAKDKTTGRERRNDASDCWCERRNDGAKHKTTSRLLTRKTKRRVTFHGTAIQALMIRLQQSVWSKGDEKFSNIMMMDVTTSLKIYGPSALIITIVIN